MNYDVLKRKMNLKLIRIYFIKFLFNYRFWRLRYARELDCFIHTRLLTQIILSSIFIYLPSPYYPHFLPPIFTVPSTMVLLSITPAISLLLLFLSLSSPSLLTPQGSGDTMLENKCLGDFCIGRWTFLWQCLFCACHT